MGNLYIVATPIGNLKDITLRALEVLKSVDVIFAEDTRVTRKLLSHYGISKPVLRLLENVHHRMMHKFKNMALVTDAGTPAVSDPGTRLARELSAAGFKILPIPGPSPPPPRKAPSKFLKSGAGTQTESPGRRLRQPAQKTSGALSLTGEIPKTKIWIHQYRLRKLWRKARRRPESGRF